MLYLSTHLSGTLHLSQYRLVCNMPNPPNSDPGLAAASILNFLSLLMYWARHLPPRLPTPRSNTEPIYSHFYRVMQSIAAIGDNYPACVPRVTDLNMLRVNYSAPEAPASTPATGVRPNPPPVPPRPRRARAPEASGRPPTPQPTPRHPREGDRLQTVQEAPEALDLSSPSPQPPPTPTNKRKTLMPRRIAK